MAALARFWIRAFHLTFRVIPVHLFVEINGELGGQWHL